MLSSPLRSCRHKPGEPAAQPAAVAVAHVAVALATAASAFSAAASAASAAAAAAAAAAADERLAQAAGAAAGQHRQYVARAPVSQYHLRNGYGSGYSAAGVARDCHQRSAAS